MVIDQKIHKTTCLKIQELGAEKQVFTQLNLYFFITYFELGSFVKFQLISIVNIIAILCCVLIIETMILFYLDLNCQPFNIHFPRPLSHSCTTDDTPTNHGGFGRQFRG